MCWPLCSNVNQNVNHYCNLGDKCCAVPQMQGHLVTMLSSFIWVRHHHPSSFRPSETMNILLSTTLLFSFMLVCSLSPPLCAPVWYNTSPLCSCLALHPPCLATWARWEELGAELHSGSALLCWSTNWKLQLKGVTCRVLCMDCRIGQPDVALRWSDKKSLNNNGKVFGWPVHSPADFWTCSRR